MGIVLCIGTTEAADRERGLSAAATALRRGQLVAIPLETSYGIAADAFNANGVEALDAVARNTIDVILLDVQMPELDGLETARRLCNRYDERQRPWIIAMTANAMEGDRDNCLQAGMDDYISKPINAHALGRSLVLAHTRLMLRR